MNKLLIWVVLALPATGFAMGENLDELLPGAATDTSVCGAGVTSATQEPAVLYPQWDGSR